MASSARIDELKKKFDENPAPLLRAAGERVPQGGGSRAGDQHLPGVSAAAARPHERPHRLRPGAVRGASGSTRRAHVFETALSPRSREPHRAPPPRRHRARRRRPGAARAVVPARARRRSAQRGDRGAPRVARLGRDRSPRRVQSGEPAPEGGTEEITPIHLSTGAFAHRERLGDAVRSPDGERRERAGAGRRRRAGPQMSAMEFALASFTSGEPPRAGGGTARPARRDISWRVPSSTAPT